MESTRRVVLRGELGERFGREHETTAQTIAEVMQAIEANRPGFLQHVRTSSRYGVGYAVLMSLGTERWSVAEDQLNVPLGSKTLELVPMPIGASDNPTVMIILGVVLVALAVVAWVAAPAIVSAYGATLGVGIGTIQSAAISVGLLGLSMAVSGISGVIAGQPSLAVSDRDKGEAPEEAPSYMFRGAVNTSGQGRPVPVLIGEMLIGSHVGSTGIYTI